MKTYIPLIVGCILAFVAGFLGWTAVAITLLIGGLIVFSVQSVQKAGVQFSLEQADQKLGDAAVAILDLQGRATQLDNKYSNLRQRIEFFERREQKSNNPFGG